MSYVDELKKQINFMNEPGLDMFKTDKVKKIQVPPMDKTKPFSISTDDILNENLRYANDFSRLELGPKLWELRQFQLDPTKGK